MPQLALFYRPMCPYCQKVLKFIEENDMTIPENYNYVSTRIDISNYIDYNITEMFMANRDWPGNNPPVRGRNEFPVPDGAWPPKTHAYPVPPSRWRGPGRGTPLRIRRLLAAVGARAYCPARVP